MHAEKRLYDIRKTFVSDNQKCSILYKCIFLEPLKCRRAIKSKMLFWILFHSQKIIITVWCGLDWINGQINRWMWDSVQRDVDLLKSIDSDSSRSALDLHFLADSPAGSVSIYCTTAFFFYFARHFWKVVLYRTSQVSERFDGTSWQTVYPNTICSLPVKWI